MSKNNFNKGALEAGIRRNQEKVALIKKEQEKKFSPEVEKIEGFLKDLKKYTKRQKQEEEFIKFLNQRGLPIDKAIGWVREEEGQKLIDDVNKFGSNPLALASILTVITLSALTGDENYLLDDGSREEAESGETNPRNDLSLRHQNPENIFFSKEIEQEKSPNYREEARKYLEKIKVSNQKRLEVYSKSLLKQKKSSSEDLPLFKDLSLRQTITLPKAPLSVGACGTSSNNCVAVNNLDNDIATFTAYDLSGNTLGSANISPAVGRKIKSICDLKSYDSYAVGCVVQEYNGRVGVSSEAVYQRFVSIVTVDANGVVNPNALTLPTISSRSASPNFTSFLQKANDGNLYYYYQEEGKPFTRVTVGSSNRVGLGGIQTYTSESDARAANPTAFENPPLNPRQIVLPNGEVVNIDGSNLSLGDGGTGVTQSTVGSSTSVVNTVNTSQGTQTTAITNSDQNTSTFIVTTAQTSIFSTQTPSGGTEVTATTPNADGSTTTIVIATTPAGTNVPETTTISSTTTDINGITVSTAAPVTVTNVPGSVTTISPTTSGGVEITSATPVTDGISTTTIAATPTTAISVGETTISSVVTSIEGQTISTTAPTTFVTGTALSTSEVLTTQSGSVTVTTTTPLEQGSTLQTATTIVPITASSQVTTFNSITTDGSGTQLSTTQAVSVVSTEGSATLITTSPSIFPTTEAIVTNTTPSQVTTAVISATPNDVSVVTSTSANGATISSTPFTTTNSSEIVTSSNGTIISQTTAAGPEIHIQDITGNLMEIGISNHENAANLQNFIKGALQNLALKDRGFVRSHLLLDHNRREAREEFLNSLKITTGSDEYDRRVGIDTANNLIDSLNDFLDDPDKGKERFTNAFKETVSKVGGNDEADGDINKVIDFSGEVFSDTKKLNQSEAANLKADLDKRNLPQELKAVLLEELKNKTNLGIVVGIPIAAFAVLVAATVAVVVYRRKTRREEEARNGQAAAIAEDGFGAHADDATSLLFSSSSVRSVRDPVPGLPEVVGEGGPVIGSESAPSSVRSVRGSGRGLRGDLELIVPQILPEEVAQVEERREPVVNSEPVDVVISVPEPRAEGVEEPISPQPSPAEELQESRQPQPITISASPQSVPPLAQRVRLVGDTIPSQEQPAVSTVQPQSADEIGVLSPGEGSVASDIRGLREIEEVLSESSSYNSPSPTPMTPRSSLSLEQVVTSIRDDSTQTSVIQRRSPFRE